MWLWKFLLVFHLQCEDYELNGKVREKQVMYILLITNTEIIDNVSQRLRLTVLCEPCLICHNSVDSLSLLLALSQLPSHMPLLFRIWQSSGLDFLAPSSFDLSGSC